MVKIHTFDHVIDATKNDRRSLLIGNGFSARFFNYKNLLDKSNIKEGDPLFSLFVQMGTVDFEAVIDMLENASQVERAYDNLNSASLFSDDAIRLRSELVNSIRETHPKHRDDISDHFESARAFLNLFHKYYTLNYDLLLYWIQLNTKGYSDGFGLGEEKDGFRGPFKAHAHCNTYNLHGGLHLFLDEVGEVQKCLMSDTGVIDAIATQIIEERRLPIYVAEGTWTAKMAKINSVAYLRHCYNCLEESNGSFFVFGHSAAMNDKHIYKAIFNSNVNHVYFGVYNITDNEIKELDARLAGFMKLGDKNIEYSFFDSTGVNVWG